MFALCRPKYGIMDLLQWEHPEIWAQMGFHMPQRYANGQWPYLRNGWSDTLHVWFYGRVFRVGARRIEWRYFRLHQIQVGSRSPSWIISNGRISAMAHPIHFVFGSRVWFSGSADRMALFRVISNPRWRLAAILEKFWMAVSPQRVMLSTSC